MALPSTGEISMSNINVELGRSATAEISLNEAAVRNLLGKPTAGSEISLQDGRGRYSIDFLIVAEVAAGEEVIFQHRPQVVAVVVEYWSVQIQ